MPLLSYNPMEDGEPADANLWNARLSAIHDLLNGNLDAANLKNGAVTAPKLANEAVTSEKLNVNVYIDGNGWTVSDYGSHKTYTKRFTGTPGVTVNYASNFNILSLDLPVGVPNLGAVSISTNLMASDRSFVLGSWSNLSSTKLSFSISNWYPDPLPLTSYIIDVTLMPL